MGTTDREDEERTHAKDAAKERGKRRKKRTFDKAKVAEKAVQLPEDSMPQSSFPLEAWIGCMKFLS